jgi:serine/threonine protein kinase
MADFLNAISSPDTAFKGLHSDLATGKPVLTKLGKPWFASGGFAQVFKFQTFSPQKLWAIKCFNRLPPDVEIHYQDVSDYLKHSPIVRHFLEVSFFKQGIRTRDGKIHPILRMEWAQGEDLRTFIKNNLGDSFKLKTLAQAWLKLCEHLTAQGIAHGDIQHDNIYVTENQRAILIKMIDYDSLYIISTGKDIKDVIKGIEGYQHPLRHKVQKRCIEVDYFSHLVIYLSILALVEDNNLWRSLNLDNKEHLLFAVKDFESPQQSAIFSTLFSQFSPDVINLARKLETLCQMSDINQIPPLSAITGNTLSPVVTQPTRWHPNKPIVVPPVKDSQSLPWKPKNIEHLSQQPQKTIRFSVSFHQSQQNQPSSHTLPQNNGGMSQTSTPPFQTQQSQTNTQSTQLTGQHNVPSMSPTLTLRRYWDLVTHNPTLIAVSVSIVMATFFYGLSLVKTIQELSSFVATTIDESKEEELWVKQQGKDGIHKNKILLRKKYKEKFKKHQSMLFWVENSDGNSDFSNKKSMDTIRVEGRLRIWYYTGSAAPKAEDFAGFLFSGTYVPFEDHDSFLLPKQQNPKAWLVQLTLKDEERNKY